MMIALRLRKITAKPWSKVSSAIGLDLRRLQCWFDSQKCVQPSPTISTGSPVQAVKTGGKEATFGEECEG